MWVWLLEIINLIGKCTAIVDTITIVRNVCIMNSFIRDR